MSMFTDRTHEMVLKETLAWLEEKPKNREQYYEYAQYCYQLKDFQQAVKFYTLAADEQHVPAMYQLAYCMHHQLGSASNKQQQDYLFNRVIVHDTGLKDTQAMYRLGMCYTYGYGVEKDECKGFELFQRIFESHPAAAYELALFYRFGKGNIDVDFKQAEVLLRKAYDQDCEQSIFELFDLYNRKLDKFPYVREIKEAYSFKLGRLMRVAELKPCKEYLMRLADFYRQGYPGDTGEKKEHFIKFAQRYEQAASQILEEC